MNAFRTVDSGTEARSGGLAQKREHWPHVACIIDGSEDSLRALPIAVRTCAGGGRLTVLLADRWSGLAMSCSEWAVDLEVIREGGEAWVRERLGTLGITDVDVAVLD